LHRRGEALPQHARRREPYRGILIVECARDALGDRGRAHVLQRTGGLAANQLLRIVQRERDQLLDGRRLIPQGRSLGSQCRIGRPA
jgi:hypothetical protein